MKKRILTLMAIIPVAYIMIGADDRPAPEPITVEKKHCSGYTILEAGVGIDCYGDTVKLVKKYGYYELASRYSE